MQICYDAVPEAVAIHRLRGKRDTGLQMGAAWDEGMQKDAVPYLDGNRWAGLYRRAACNRKVMRTPSASRTGTGARQTAQTSDSDRSQSSRQSLAHCRCRLTERGPGSGAARSAGICLSARTPSGSPCQIPVVRGYQIECGSSCQSCLPRGFARSAGSSSARRTISCGPPGRRTDVISKANGV